ncbi:MAG: hypothetical protein GY842_08520 [bacterium]|nr:hypothetical protein [bacterium]
MTKTIFCPREHECSHSTSSHGVIYCPTCQNWRKCSRCGWESTRRQTAATVACPTCDNAVPIVGGWWLNESALLRAGGSVEEDGMQFSGRLEGTQHPEGTYTGEYYTDEHGAIWYHIDYGDGFLFETTDEPPPTVLDLIIPRIVTFAEWPDNQHESTRMKTM